MVLWHGDGLFLLRASARGRTEPEVDNGRKGSPKHTYSYVYDAECRGILRFCAISNQIYEYYKEADRDNSRYNWRPIRDGAVCRHQPKKGTTCTSRTLDRGF